jgi:hypothetical protein
MAPPGPRTLSRFRHLGQRVELVQVHVVGLEQLQRLLQLRARVVLHAAFGLAGQEALLAIGRERRPQPLLRIAVAGRNVEVVDAAIHGLGHDVRGRAGLLVHHHNAAEADHRQMFAGLAQRAPRNGVRCGLGLSITAARRCKTGCGNRCMFQKDAAFHGLTPWGGMRRSAYAKHSCTFGLRRACGITGEAAGPGKNRTGPAIRPP